ncbi:hypothetical protein ACFPES_25305 [Paenibacillus sp. GCM10023248]|uniref:hypothetical protein n=1 Tax=unclassified Paenibacillus TaxID=185978 RepID=UPI0023797853|nr:hypothetical protein [Paenibacillus sp. MAHUQ-63]MDD9270379.1 hypothetical protein [Paenibacillus sp. MAHUQ-63]
MPYVLLHRNTHQIYTCMQVNHYGLAYYGVKFWLDEEEAAQQYQALLQPAEGIAAEEWQVIELEESEMKICNVKLKNDPALQLFWSSDRKPEVRKLEN